MRLIITLLFTTFTATAALAAMTDDEVKEAIIKESIAKSPVPCPCPFSLMSNGKECGGQSVFLHPGGEYEPICYDAQVTQEMIRAYRRKHGQ